MDDENGVPRFSEPPRFEEIWAKEASALKFSVREVARD